MNKIKTIEDLESAIENYQEKCTNKNIAILLINAMNDWPTENQSSISEFISEFKTYIGEPITINKISSKSLSANKAWKSEASSSIRELLELSEKYHNEVNLDTIINSCLEHFESK